MKKLLLLLVPLVLLVGCETSAEVAVEPPQSDVIVGKLIVCSDELGMQHQGISNCWRAAREKTTYLTRPDSSATIAGLSATTLWKVTVLTPQGTTYTVYTDFWKDLDEFLSDENYDGWLSVFNEKLPQRAPEPKLGDPWPPSE